MPSVSATPLCTRNIVVRTRSKWLSKCVVLFDELFVHLKLFIVFVVIIHFSEVSIFDIAVVALAAVITL